MGPIEQTLIYGSLVGIVLLSLIVLIDRLTIPSKKKKEKKRHLKVIK